MAKVEPLRKLTKPLSTYQAKVAETKTLSGKKESFHPRPEATAFHLQSTSCLQEGRQNPQQWWDPKGVLGGLTTVLFRWACSLPQRRERDLG